MKWQPIETAPEDTFVLTYCPEYYGDEYGIAYWDSTDEEWIAGFMPLSYAPTHWMHLPEPPEENK